VSGGDESGLHFEHNFETLGNINAIIGRTGGASSGPFGSRRSITKPSLHKKQDTKIVGQAVPDEATTRRKITPINICVRNILTYKKCVF